MKRCHLCKGYIWPWQIAYYIRDRARLPDLFWHKRCRAAFDRILQEDADRWERGVEARREEWHG